MSVIRWVTEGRLKRADCCTRWEGDGYKDVVLGEDYDALLAENARLNMEMVAYREKLTPKDVEAMTAVIKALTAEKAARTQSDAEVKP